MKPFLLLCLLGISIPASSEPKAKSGAHNLLDKPVIWPTFPDDDFEPRIAAVQYLLRGGGFYRGPIDGFYGVKMVAAVKNFQRKNRLKVDGVMGPKTLPKLVVRVQRGSRGDAVRAAQILARNAEGHNGELPYAALEADGVFGQQTEDAVKWAQSMVNEFEKRLPENGIMTARWCLMLGGRVAGDSF